jgi:DNA-binding XRE family transcriptional regulator
MDLATWMAINDLNDQTVADAVGVTRPYIHRVRKGDVNPTLATALKLWHYTKKQVELEQMLPSYLRPDITRPRPGARPGTPRRPAAKSTSKSPAAA